MERLRSGLLFLGLVLASVNVAHATLLDGETVEVSYRFPTDGTIYAGPVNVLVGAGVEILNFPPQNDIFDLDISDTNLYFDYHSNGAWTPAAFNGVRIFDIFATIPAFTSVVVNVATNLGGFSAANVTFDADTILINWQGLSFSNETVVSLDVNGGEPVPEPSTGLLLLAGASLLARLRNSRTRR